MRKHYNNFKEIDNDIRILQLQKDIAVADLQNHVQTAVSQIKGGGAEVPTWLKAVRFTQRIVFLRKHNIAAMLAEFAIRRWLFRRKKR